jgi:hypothetical protein
MVYGVLILSALLAAAAADDADRLKPPWDEYWRMRLSLNATASSTSRSSSLPSNAFSLSPQCRRPTYLYVAGVEGSSNHGLDALLPELNMLVYRSLPAGSSSSSSSSSYYYYYYNGSSIPSADAVGTVCLRYSWNSYPTHVAGLDEPARLSLLFGDSCKQTKNGCKVMPIHPNP